MTRPAPRRVAAVAVVVLALLALLAVVAIRAAGNDAPHRGPSTQVGALVLTRTGGIGGWDDRLVVFADGTWVEVRQGADPIQGRLSDAQRRRLTAALDRVDLRHHSSGHRFEDACCDLFFYSLDYRGSHYDTVDEHVPVSVQDVLDLVKPQLEAPHAVATLTP